jgi:hypothetical protein
MHLIVHITSDHVLKSFHGNTTILANEVVIVSINIDGKYAAVSCCPYLLLSSFHENLVELIHLLVLYLEFD